MDDKTVREALKSLKEQKRKFSQSVDLIVSLKHLDFKKPEEQVEFYMQVHKTLGKKRTVCALVGPEMAEDAKVFDKVVTLEEFDKLQKKEMKKIAASYDFFIGQANIMPKIAQSWGRILGPRGKMPNPKAGGVVPPKAPLEPLYEKFQRTIKISAKKSPNVQVRIGTEEMDEEDLIDNIKTVYDQLLQHLPQEKNNVKHVYVKLTMSKPVMVQ